MLETSINGARGVLMNITGGPDLSLLEGQRGGGDHRRERRPGGQHHLRRGHRRGHGRLAAHHGHRHGASSPSARSRRRRRAACSAAVRSSRSPPSNSSSSRPRPFQPSPFRTGAQPQQQRQPQPFNSAAYAPRRPVAAEEPAPEGGAAGQRRRPLARARPQARLQRKAQEQAGRARVPAQISAAAVRQDRSPSKRPARTPGGAFAAGRPQTPLLKEAAHGSQARRPPPPARRKEPFPMQPILMMILPDCPHCRRARALLDELRSENPAYAAVPLQIEDERPQQGARRRARLLVRAVLLCRRQKKYTRASPRARPCGPCSTRRCRDAPGA